MIKRTIVFVQNVDFPQQGAIDIFYYAKYLSIKEDTRVVCIVSQIEEDILHDNLQIAAIGHTSYLNFIRKAYKIIKEINRKNKIDYVYFFAQNPFSVVLQFFVQCVLKIQTIYDVVSGPIGNGLISFLSKHTIKAGVYLSQKYVVLDEGLIQKLGLPRKKIHKIIPMGYDEERFFPSADSNVFDKKENEIIFTYIGTLNVERNLDIFVQAFVQATKENDNIKLYFIGEGSGKEKIKQTAGESLNKNIFLLGKKEHKTIPNYINSSDILVSYVPKVDYFEYQPPTKLIEYLACDKPVIATDTFAQQEILKNYKNLIHEDDIDSTQKQIQYCIENIAILQKGNYKKEIEKYSWKQLVGEINNLF